jgi:hypothetical protein
VKYLVFKRTYCDCDQRVPVLFPNYLAHDEVATALYALLGEPVNAGHCSSLDLTVERGRKSNSTGLGPGEHDELLLQMHDYTSGLVT